MNKLLTVTAIVEAATGLALIVTPLLVGQLLLGSELSGVALVIARVTGIALLSLGVACWPGSTPLFGMLAYNALALAYLAWLGIGGQWAGPLLWPAVGLHAVLTVLLARAWRAAHAAGASNASE